MTEPAPPRRKEFIAEVIAPVEGSFATPAMAAGEPGVPRRFRWREVEYEVAAVLDTWRTTGPCRNGSGEKYVRKHWFRVQTTDGEEMEICFDRQSRTRQKKNRWWLATVVSPEGTTLQRVAVVSYPTFSDDDSRWIEALRTAHCPEAAMLPAHVTFVFPACLPVEGLAKEVKAVATSSKTIPFVVRRAQAVRDPLTGTAHVFLVPHEGAREMTTVHDRLYGGSLRRRLRQDLPFEPHITAGSCAAPERCEAIVEALNRHPRTVPGMLVSLDLIKIAGDVVSPVTRFILGEA